MPEKVRISLNVNGANRIVDAHPLARLLDVLREDLGLKATKEGCGEGECGACAVLMDGRLVNSCLVPVIQARGAELVTLEGLGGDHPLQEAFHVKNGAQCGFCSPGMILASEALLRRCPDPDEGEIREGLAGNLCRCTGYSKIIDAVQAGRRA
jgi:aerobic carbon-monoxide dehydrogenase small subunit